MEKKCILKHNGTLSNQEAKHELKLYVTPKRFSLCPVSIYLGVKLDKTLTCRPHLEALRKKLSASVLLLSRLAGSGWGASAKRHYAQLPYIFGLLQRISNGAPQGLARCATLAFPYLLF